MDLKNLLRHKHWQQHDCQSVAFRYQDSCVPCNSQIQPDDLPIQFPSKYGERVVRSDHELLQGVASGCEDSFRVLFERWSPRLRSFLIRSTGSRELGEDLLQEAFLRILRAAPRYEPRGKVSSWMYRICANLAYSFWRREHRSPLCGADPHEIESYAVDAGTAGPETRLLRSVFTRDVENALQQLPANQHMVFLLKTDRGLTYKEIASILQCPEGTVKSRFHHAIRKLRDILKEWADEPASEPLTGAGLLHTRRPQTAGGSAHLVSVASGLGSAALAQREQGKQLGRRTRRTS